MRKNFASKFRRESGTKRAPKSIIDKIIVGIDIFATHINNLSSTARSIDLHYDVVLFITATTTTSVLFFLSHMNKEWIKHNTTYYNQSTTLMEYTFLKSRPWSFEHRVHCMVSLVQRGSQTLRTWSNILTNSNSSGARFQKGTSPSPLLPHLLISTISMFYRLYFYWRSNEIQEPLGVAAKSSTTHIIMHLSFDDPCPCFFFGNTTHLIASSKTVFNPRGNEMVDATISLIRPGSNTAHTSMDVRTFLR